jgi:hypothetical protein
MVGRGSSERLTPLGLILNIPTRETPKVDVVNQKKNAPEEIFEAIHMHVSQRWP